jgi:hypothetical protein
MSDDTSTMRPVARLVVSADDTGQVALQIGVNGLVCRQLVIDALTIAATTLRAGTEIDIEGRIHQMLINHEDHQ